MSFQNAAFWIYEEYIEVDRIDDGDGHDVQTHQHQDPYRGSQASICRPEFSRRVSMGFRQIKNPSNALLIKVYLVPTHRYDD